MQSQNTTGVGALIDMDGVLYDSMPLHTVAWKQLMDAQGINCTREEFFLYEGMTGRDTIKMIFKRELNRDISDRDADALYKIKSESFNAMGGAKLMPGAQRMIAELGRLGLIRVLVTGSSQASVLNRLNTDYPNVFSDGHRVTARDVRHGKPDPEPYLKGAELAGLPPKDCIVIENAPLGVRAGKAAGCFVIAVTTGPIPREEFVKEGADLIFESMSAFADYLETCTNPSDIYGWYHHLNLLTKSMKSVDKVVILTDSNVYPVLIQQLSTSLSSGGVSADVISVPAGEQSKSAETLLDLLHQLRLKGATRNTVLVNIGGGMISDLGGLAASLYMRGIRHINVPTTILAMADAAIGGKTAIDFDGVKNLIGTFKMPADVITDPIWLKTLPQNLITDGFAEVVKSAMLDSEPWYGEILGLEAPLTAKSVGQHVRRSANFKEKIVKCDPNDQNLRRILNFGHTVGHALEALAVQHGEELSHGMAVAHGIYAALLISHRLLALDKKHAETYRASILEKFFPALPDSVKDVPVLMELMAIDKKNKRHGEMQFVLLRRIGEPEESTPVSSTIVEEVLREMF